MNNLLIFFAFPIAVIIISIILQKLLNNPVLVAALIFAIFLIITFSFFDETFLIATLAYTILAFITALITKIICNCNGEDSDNICNSINNILGNNTTNNNTENTCTRTASTKIASNPNNCFNYTYNRYRHF